MPNTRSHSITSTILSKYFSYVTDLRSYLATIIDEEGQVSFQPSSTDTPPYFDLLNTSHVALKLCEGTDGQRSRFKCFSLMVGMRDVIDQAQVRIFKSSQPQNMITIGYKKGMNGGRGNSRRTSNFFTNTIVTALLSPSWETLLQRIGEDAMLHLLTETSLFTELPNGCLCQITGPPIVYLTVPSNDNDRSLKKALPDTSSRGKKRPLPPFTVENESPSKRRKLESGPSRSNSGSGFASRQPKVTKLLPADIPFARARMFYARPNFIPHSNRIIVGLPMKHVLNKVRQNYDKESKSAGPHYLDPDPEGEIEQSRHVAKYIFPRQHGLESPFRMSTIYRDAHMFPDYLDREAEIRAKFDAAKYHRPPKTWKTPKRLKEILPLIDQLAWRHYKCRYALLRDHACPSKTYNKDKTIMESSIILEYMSEQSIQPRSQVSLGNANTSVDSSGNSIVPYGLTQAKQHAKAKPRFAEFACTYVEVYRYTVLVTKSVIPKAFWGCDSNFKVVMRNLKDFITCRRFESLTLHHVLQGFSTSMCDWLMPPGDPVKKQTRVSVSDALKRRELLEEFVFWYFDSFVMQLLKTTFYVTESAAFRNQVLYFRQDDWVTLCNPLVEKLTTGTFEIMTDVDAVAILNQRKLGFSFVRLLPKETGVRPIVNLRRKVYIISPVISRPDEEKDAERKSINQILSAAFSILTYEREKQPHLLGAAVFSPDDVYSRLKNFKSRLPCNVHGDLPKLYFVKVDVQACFDTIEQNKLLEILRDIITDDKYLIQRYGKVTMTSERIRRAYVRRAKPSGDHPHFLEYAAELAGLLRNSIFVDQVIYPLEKKQEILHLLEEHITENIVKIGQRYYRQTVGIPQGSVLSAILCSFFYGDLEKRFGNFTDDSQSVLLRFIDDYLFITTSLRKAKAFLNMMNNGHPEYGCFISKEKTLTNFDYDDQVLNVVEEYQQNFLWCGYAINMKNLSVSVDYSRYNGIRLDSTLTVHRGRQPGSSFTFKMLQLAKSKSHIIYTDTDLNTEHVVYLSVYQNFLLTAIKMDLYLRDWGICLQKRSTFLLGNVRKIISFCYFSLKVQTQRRVAKAHDAQSKVQKCAIVWFGHHAFHTILSKKPVKYASLLKELKFELSRPRSQRYQKRFSRILREGQASLMQVMA